MQHKYCDICPEAEKVGKQMYTSCIFKLPAIHFCVQFSQTPQQL